LAEKRPALQKSHKPVYMIKTKVAFLEGRLLSSQSELFEKFSKSPDWLEKIILQIKRALSHIHPCTLYVEFTVRVGAKLRQ